MLKDLHTYFDDKSNKKLVKDFSNLSKKPKYIPNNNINNKEIKETNLKSVISTRLIQNKIPLMPATTNNSQKYMLTHNNEMHNKIESSEKIKSQVNEKLEINRKFLVLDPINKFNTISNHESYNNINNNNFYHTSNNTTNITPRHKEALYKNYSKQSIKTIKTITAIGNTGNKKIPVHTFSTLAKNTVMRKILRDNMNETLTKFKEDTPLKLRVINSSVKNLLDDVRKSAKNRNYNYTPTKMRSKSQTRNIGTNNQNNININTNTSIDNMSLSISNDNNNFTKKSNDNININNDYYAESKIKQKSKVKRLIIKEKPISPSTFEVNVNSHNAYNVNNYNIMHNDNKKKLMEFAKFKKNILSSNNHLKLIRIKSDKEFKSKENLTLNHSKSNKKSLLLQNFVHTSYNTSDKSDDKNNNKNMSPNSHILNTEKILFLTNENENKNSASNRKKIVNSINSNYFGLGVHKLKVKTIK